jgi:hypothetical protein
MCRSHKAQKIGIIQKAMMPSIVKIISPVFRDQQIQNPKNEVKRTASK